MSVEISRMNRSYSEPSPQQTRLPPLSSILNRSPIQESNYNHQQQQQHIHPLQHIPFNITSTPCKTKITLPSIENLTSSPNFKRSNSYPQSTYTSSSNNNNNFDTSSNSIRSNTSINQLTPVTPLNQNILPPPIFTQQSQSQTQTQTQSQSHHSTPQIVINNNNNNNNNNNQKSFITPQSSFKKRTISSPQSEGKSFAFISHSQATFLSAEPDIDNARLARRKRRRTSPTELAILQLEFEKGSTPNKQRRLNIANKVDMTEKAVQIWFQNKRQSLRKNNQNIKEIVLDIPKRHDLDQQLMSAEELEEKGIMITTRSSPFNSSSPASLKQLPPTGVFMTPMKTPQSQQQQQQQPLTSSSSSSVTNHNFKPMTFKFKTSELGLLTPIQNSSKRQKPTMKLEMNGNKENIQPNTGATATATNNNNDNNNDFECVKNLLSLKSRFN
ncbi:hypothetical protein CANARDRAFT_202846 [[Candida] arabinofermentans NRRL YB-2248]|uniref:Homeobox domain-containing protein n=1 Tax=[Candida] arabinofermentans NRRL YB-2248 TaxID=983967 RepID=A0A1E4SVW8_9ASCO|nr:hypothetical protein CANARDRAFT_202846 [[Candida] arabinofermentans NRRL YB-2248]